MGFWSLKWMESMDLVVSRLCFLASSKTLCFYEETASGSDSKIIHKSKIRWGLCSYSILPFITKKLNASHVRPACFSLLVVILWLHLCLLLIRNFESLIYMFVIESLFLFLLSGWMTWLNWCYSPFLVW